MFTTDGVWIELGSPNTPKRKEIKKKNEESTFSVSKVVETLMSLEAKYNNLVLRYNALLEKYNASIRKEELEKTADKKGLNISLDDEGIMKVLMCCQAGRSCNECPYDELNSPRCRDILLNECIGLINRLKAEKVNIAREIFEEFESMAKNGIVYTFSSDFAELKKKYTEERK